MGHDLLASNPLSKSEMYRFLTINVPVVFMARYVMVLRRATSLRGALEEWALKIETFLGPKKVEIFSSLGRVPACDAGDLGPTPGGGKLNVCLQVALLEDRNDPGQVSLKYIMYQYARPQEIFQPPQQGFFSV
jgi:hypothetical protein